VAIIFIDDNAITTLSGRFRNLSHATDVLSFSYSYGDEKNAGEVVISLDTARRQSRERAVPLFSEILLLITHGLLHLQGYDDVRASDRHRMRRAEFEALVRIL